MPPRFGATYYSASSGNVAAAEVERGKKLTAGSFYCSLTATNLLARDPHIASVRDAGGAPLLNINTSFTPKATGIKTGISWNEIIEGRWDETLKLWADAIKAFNCPKLNFGVGMHEPNIVSPYQPVAPDFELTDFPALVAKVHQFFKVEQGVTNRLHVYPTISVFRSPAPKKRPPLWDTFAPDPEHYDIIGADHYNHCESWQTPAYKAEPFLATADALGKRPFLGECGNDCADERRPQWYADTAALYEAAGVLWVNWQMKTDDVAEYGLRPGTPEWTALLGATKRWT